MMNFDGRKMAMMLAAMSALSFAAERPVIHCPLKPDPPPVIDGDGREWGKVPGSISVTDKNVTWGRTKCSGEEDLSGTIKLCYDENYLYLLAEVIDDKLIVEGGRRMFNADHVELTFAPVFVEGKAGPATADWRIIGFAPGCVEETGDPLTDLEPEAFLLLPNKLDWSGIDVSASVTEDGYVLEARIPWRVLGVKGRPAPGMVFGTDVHLSDADSGVIQESLTSINTTPWKGRRLEKVPKMVLTGTDGKIKESATLVKTVNQKKQ